jgi:hypothetical protein
MRIGGAIVASAVAALILFSCDEGPTGPPPGPGDLEVTLVSPNGPEGAAVFELADAQTVYVTSEGGQVAHWLTGTATRIVVLLDEPGAIRFTMHVDDRSAATGLEVVEVADGGNQLRDDLSSYALSFSW